MGLGSTLAAALQIARHNVSWNIVSCKTQEEEQQQAREYMSKPQRMNLNAQAGKKFLPKDIQYGDLVAFPNVMPDGTRGFGIGKVVHHLTEKSFNCQWYSNPEENLLATAPLATLSTARTFP